MRFTENELMNANDSQFNYFPLVWMRHSRKLYHKINRLHGKCQRIIHTDKTSSYEEDDLKMALFIFMTRICKNWL